MMSQAITALTATAARKGDPIANMPKTISKIPQMIDQVEAWRTRLSGECSGIGDLLVVNQRWETTTRWNSSSRPKPLLAIPQRVRRPSAARKALSLDPPVKAGWTDSSRVKGVPLITARTAPFVFRAGRPAAEGAADARGLRRAKVFPFLKLALGNNAR